MRLSQFHELVSGVIKSARDIMHDQLFFGLQPPSMVLRDLRDAITNGDPGYSIVDQVWRTSSGEGGHRYMLNLMMVSAKDSERLMDEEGRWDLPKCREYLDLKKRFLQLLMLGTPSNPDGVPDSSNVYYWRDACERDRVGFCQISEQQVQSPQLLYGVGSPEVTAPSNTRPGHRLTAHTLWFDFCRQRSLSYCCCISHTSDRSPAWSTTRCCVKSKQTMATICSAPTKLLISAGTEISYLELFDKKVRNL